MTRTRTLLGAIVLAACFVAAGVPSGTPAAPQASTAPQPSASAQPSTTPQPSAASPQPWPTASSSQVAPSATPSPLYKYAFRPTPEPDATPVADTTAPQIDEVDLSDTTIVTPGTVRVRVLTSAAVTSVTADTFGQSMAIPRTALGVFALEGTVPSVPFYLRNRTYDVEFVAAVPDGRTARVTIALKLR